MKFSNSTKYTTSPAISDNQSISSLRSHGTGILPYKKSVDLEGYNDVKTSYVTPINNSMPRNFNPNLEPLNFHSSGATSLGITPSGKKLEFESMIKSEELAAVYNRFVLQNLLALKNKELVNANTKVVDLQNVIMTEVSEKEALQLKYVQLTSKFQEQNKTLNSNLLYTLSQLQYNSFASFAAKLGMFFSTGVDILYNTSLNTIVGLSIYGIAQFITNFYTRKLAAGIVSSLYSIAFNRINKILSIATIKYISYAAIISSVSPLINHYILSHFNFSTNGYAAVKEYIGKLMVEVLINDPENTVKNVIEANSTQSVDQG